MEYNFRACTLEDFEFLFNLKKENFKKYVDKIWGWDDEDQRSRLKQDLNEHLSHKKIILINNEMAGVYAVHTTENGELFINEISLLEKYQNQGIGSEILHEQLEENRKNGIKTILQVFKDNPAKKLYEKLGFKVYSETETHYQMENNGGMYMRELAVAIQNENEKVDIRETINAIKEAGFKNVFVQWYDEDLEYSQEEQVKLCKELGFNILFAHLGYQNINSIWEEGELGESLVERYKKDIKDCYDNGIDMVVMHVVSKHIAPPYGEIGLNRIRKITEYAKELNVKVAFENTKIREYIEYVLDNIKDDNVGMCFDAGHFHAYFDDDFDFESVKDRIFAVHLHDNDKSDDLHLLPFDGTMDWKNVMKKLEDSNYKGPVTLELCYRYDYLNMPLTDFYKLGYERGLELAKY